jgi:methylated-DNA-[protein]-cysteine S-methyltransferase
MTASDPVTYWYEIDSPVGPLLLAGDEQALLQVHFQSGRQRLRPQPQWRHGGAALRASVLQLEQYFAGRRRGFDLALRLVGTPFQQKVWRELQQIPYGQTISYGELARRVGLQGGARAVGLANGSNPVPIIVPCHRVIGSDGSLTGFGGGLPIKRALLSLEGAECVADLFSSLQPNSATSHSSSGRRSHA